MHAVMGGIVITDLCCKDHVKCKGEVKLQGRFFVNNEAREGEGEGENYNKGCMSCIILVAVARFYYWLTSK